MRNRLIQSGNKSSSGILGGLWSWWSGDKNKNESEDSASYNSIVDSHGSINGDRNRSVSLSMSHYTEMTPAPEIGSQQREQSVLSTVSSAGAVELYQYYSDTYQDIKGAIDKDPYLLLSRNV